VSQAGWVVLPVAALSADGLRASAAYVLVYAVATLVAFAAVAVVGAGPLERTRGLLRRDRLTGGALALALLVLAGLPPGVIGLVAKVVALRPAVDAGLWPLALVAVVAVVLGIAVYLRWFALLVGEPRPEPGPGPDAEAEPGSTATAVVPASRHRGASAVLVLGTGVLVLFSVLPGLLLGLLS
jgi:NADH-quinone oxidoreductase subunit N